MNVVMGGWLNKDGGLVGSASGGEVPEHCGASFDQPEVTWVLGGMCEWIYLADGRGHW